MYAEKDWDFYKTQVDAALENNLDDPRIPQRLAEAMRYSVFAGGKRLRPVLLLAACDLFDGCLSDALPLACAIEMIHTYSLIHDDLPAMDNDDYRRGRLTCHKVFGEAMAILSGDALLNYAFEVALAGGFRNHIDQNAYFAAVRCLAVAAGARGMVAGQVKDLENEGDTALSARQLEDIHRHKTGAIITASVLAGALVNAPSDEQRDAIERYGNALGIAFQIEDDILDVVGTAANLGKTPGKDAQAGKVTYVSLYGLDGAREKAAEFTEQAVEALRIFTDKARFLTDLAQDMLRRDH